MAHRWIARVALALALTLALTACAPDLTPEGTPDAGAPDAGSREDGSIPAESGPFRHELGADGVITTTVDATPTDAWAYLDLESGLAVTPGDPFASDAWDLGFQRFYVTTNGGASGSGGAAAARLTDTGWDEVTEAPETGWIADAVDGEEDDDTGPDTAFNGGPGSANDWYDYDPATHRLTPKADLVFVVRSVEGAFFKIEMLGYYDGAGTPGVVRFRWARVGGGAVDLPDAGPPIRPDAGMPADAAMEEPIPTDALTIDASSRDDLVYVRVGAGVVSIADPSTSLDWDLAFRRALVQTSSGTSGPGVGGARSAGVVARETVTETDTIGFAIDEIDDGGGMPGATPASTNPILGDWFDYDLATHTVTPKRDVWIVRTARGTYARMRIWSWEDGVFRVSLDPIDAAPITRTFDIDASAAGAWAYVDLHAAAAIEPADASTDARWDLGLSRTLLRTSSGTSGPGAGGAIDTGAADPTTVTTIPEGGWIADDERPTPGPPGSPTYSGNGALELWYDYDPATHAVSPRATTFLVRLADGSAGRLRITAWASGAFTLEWTYAGPGRTSF